MSLDTRLLHPTLACEVIGLRLWEEQPPDTVAELRDLWSLYGVLVFRRQALGEAELARFCALFGPLERTVRTDWASPVVPEIGLISNMKDAQGNAIGGLGDGEIEWHSDQSYMRHPATGAGLYAIELPPAGGTTSWVDLRAAYAGMPERLRAEIAGKRAVFSYAKRLAGYQEGSRTISEDAKRRTPPVTHTLLHTHPVTGEAALYLDKTTTIGVEGMGANAGTALLDEIYDAAVRPEFVYTHQWQVGDLLLWDNGFTMHRREPFDATARRLMKRTTMKLDPARHIIPEGALAA